MEKNNVAAEQERERKNFKKQKNKNGKPKEPRSAEQNEKKQAFERKPQAEKKHPTAAQSEKKTVNVPQPLSKNQKKKQKQKGNGNVGEGKDTYAYVIDGSIYINLTNKCSNGCEFCVRNERERYSGYELWLKKGEPTAEKTIEAIKDCGGVAAFKEVVFCGFGEPTYRMAEMLAVCDFVHAEGGKTRLNTNGQGCLINKRDIVPELKGKLDFVNVSMNAPDAESYQKLCRSMFREDGYTAMIEFAKALKRNRIPCRFSVVDYIGEEAVQACKKVAEGAGVPLYVRTYIDEE